jgi:E3 ubiquitin-protein ligase MARCH6
LVYGALVILCLGGVVWGIYFSFENVFPIHWSSNEPVLEFPVDLLFYNFLMPLAVKFFKPSVGLNRMYGWWFRKCARTLRLSHFLFGERAEDEEGYHVRCSWKDWLLRKKGDYKNPASVDERRVLTQDQAAGAFFVRDGRYVRAPASDQVRIPKGIDTFLEVDEKGARSDGLPDPDQGLHGSKNDMFSMVYIPPYFRVRVSLFILLIWLFAAATGVALTIVPLVLGRYVFTFLIPNHLRMNDIYAFSIGLYLLGGTLYGIINFRRISTFVLTALSPNPRSNTAALLRHTRNYGIRLLRLLYTYFSFAFLLPALFSLLVEVYIIIPLHTYFGAPSERHIIHFIQDWTLGVLYVKVLGRLILWNSPSRPANALRGIMRHGWLNPDIRLATRSFIFPASVVMAFALVAPLAMGWGANKSIFFGADATFHNRVYRYSYPAMLTLGFVMFGAYGVGAAFRGWRQRIRDEVYLIGERLHNFGERKVVAARVNVKMGF